MDTAETKFQRQEYVTKILLTSIFLGVFALVVWLGGLGMAGEFRPSVFDWVLLAFATYRLGRLVAYDVVMEPLRSPVAHTVPDHTGAGESVEARGQGFRRAVGQMISCPICAGTWIAALLTYALYLVPGPTRLFLVAAATIGAAELLNSLTEALSWTGQLARTRTGVELRQADPARQAQASAADSQSEPSGSKILPGYLPYTQEALCAALEHLLAQQSQFYRQPASKDNLSRMDLRLEDVRIEGGEAFIRLSGSVAGGQYESSRLISQMEGMARQFSAIHRVSILLNGQPIHSALSR